ncbi:uncharacterized protein EV422DRAFT_583137 [Fimicolochytrium jonesii]|uniref:uncharacterized protein n=1 Tax=Fimicolochytrium jonesii TaxID=1396493 RepID=UPI0022FECB24|nr:uncharacterized protein EV422DRAFT_583137 [Fimicolochytrium jonesii]KAI8825696.1 hypothetical protein EV422DRAFT_583137 [Fimicolochytrium jonesii]
MEWSVMRSIGRNLLCWGNRCGNRLTRFLSRVPDTLESFVWRLAAVHVASCSAFNPGCTWRRSAIPLVVRFLVWVRRARAGVARLLSCVGYGPFAWVSLCFGCPAHQPAEYACYCYIRYCKY